MESLRTIILELIQKKNTENIGIKIIATGGTSLDQFFPSQNPSLIIFTVPPPSYPKTYFQKGIVTVTSTLQRCLPLAKTTSYLPAIVALQNAQGAQEALFLNDKGEFLEATTSNLFFIKEGSLITSGSDEILFGITRQVVLELAKKEFSILFQNLPLAELKSIDEAFITATNKEIMPIACINGIPLPHSPGPKTLQLMDKFEKFVHSATWPDLPIERHQDKEMAIF